MFFDKRALTGGMPYPSTFRIQVTMFMNILYMHVRVQYSYK